LGARKGYTNRIEVLTFVDGGLLLHGCKKQSQSSEFVNQRVNESFEASVKKTPEQHFSEIAQTITLAKEHNIA
jgi:D-citramalate synthase